MSNNYTERTFWEEYWKSHQINPTHNVFFADLVKDWPTGGKSFVEIGGFPGSFAAWFAREKKYDVTLLDYVVLPDVVRRVEEINGIPTGTIKTIESDFFNYTPEKQYDVVFSVGFIEHFEDTFDVVERHINLLSRDGMLFLTLPNFKGVNGLIQKIFDKKNYKIHNIKCMDIEYLRKILNKLNMENVSVEYFGKPTIWLEKIENRSWLLRKFISLFSKIIRRVPFYHNKVFATHIIVFGSKGI